MGTGIKLKAAVLAAAALLTVMLSSCSGDKYVSRTVTKLDTVVTITIYGDDDTAPIEGAFAEIDRLTGLLDVNVPESDIARLAENAGEWVEVSREAAEVIALAKQYYELSRGYFDITAAPLIDLWDIGGEGHFPDSDELEAAMALVDGAAIQLDGNMARLEKVGMKADLGGIAKGYIADKVRECLIACGVESAIIDLGGNLQIIGSRPDGKAFNIGIKDPFGENGEVLTALRCSDTSLVTSGIYERYFEFDGKRYHHIIDPFTGFPSESDIASATIMGANSVQCDALSTVSLLIGSEKALELIENSEGFEALLVTRGGEVLTTSSWPE